MSSVFNVESIWRARRPVVVLVGVVQSGAFTQGQAIRFCLDDGTDEQANIVGFEPPRAFTREHGFQLDQITVDRPGGQVGVAIIRRRDEQPFWSTEGLKVGPVMGL